MNSGVSSVSSSNETPKSLTVDECLAEVFASVDLPDSIDR